MDWGISNEPVVIAHAGAFQCGVTELEKDVFPIIGSMLRGNDNLFVDISGLCFRSLTMVLSEVDNDRILFGSDALYEPQWASVVMLMRALEGKEKNVEESYIRISSENPSRTIFKNEYNNKTP
jgi:hypothetical protein